MKALLEHLYSMKINEQTRKCSKHGFEVVDKAKLVWFEEIFEEYKKYWSIKVKSLDLF